jgi:hypothetical protein
MADIWTEGIIVKNSENGWSASCEWQTGKFAESGRMKGEIATTYYESTLDKAVEYVLDTMESMNVLKVNEVEVMKDKIDFSLTYEAEVNQPQIIPDQVQYEAEKHGWEAVIEIER